MSDAPEPTGYFTVDPSDGEQARPIPTDPVSETARRCAEIARQVEHESGKLSAFYRLAARDITAEIAREFGLEEQA